MNVIRFKDIIHPTDELFNKKLKGKYAYWIQMRYAVSFDDLNYYNYIRAEQDPSLLDKLNIYYVDTNSCGNNICQYIDSEDTNDVNNINNYIIKNNFQPDADITVDELKNFRTWLATSLLSFDLDVNGNPDYTIFDEKTTHMLEYYKNGMDSDVIHYISMFSSYDVEYYTTKSTGCSCCGDSNISSLYNNGIIICDPESKYRQYIYNYMVEVFSDVEFWNQFSKEFLMDFKKYIDNIIRYNFKLTKSQYISDFVDCGCLSNDDINQKEMINILNMLSTSLSYYINDDVNGHKNYILNSLTEWSKLLYENMEWA